MILPLVITSLLGCRTTLRPDVEVPDADVVREWDHLLGRVVDDEGYVDYALLEKKRGTLDRFVAWIGRSKAIRGRGGPPAHAFWINAYNALVLYQVLEHDTPRSVLSVAPRVPQRGWGFFFWHDFVVDGEAPASLWEIGHERIIEAQQDYRDFAVLTVAARSSPPLRAELYDAERLHAQLDEQFTTFMSDDRGVVLEEDRAMFNPLFERYERTFSLITSQADLCRVAAWHTSGRKSRRLEELADEGCPHGFFPFDWGLNGREVE